MVEAVSERESVKASVLQSLDTVRVGLKERDSAENTHCGRCVRVLISLRIVQAVSKDCILASNTSSISITRLAAATSRPDKVVS